MFIKINDRVPGRSVPIYSSQRVHRSPAVLTTGRFEPILDAGSAFAR